MNRSSNNFSQQAGYTILGGVILSTIIGSAFFYFFSKIPPFADSQISQSSSMGVFIEESTPEKNKEIAEPPRETESPVTLENPDNSMGLTLEEYSNLSDPTEEMLNCLKNEGGKGCFSEEYDPNVPIPYYQQPRYSSASNSKAISVATGRVLPYWQPSSLPPVPHGVCSRFHMVKFGDRYYCGRRLINP